MRRNRDAFARLARAKEGDRSRLLVKVDRRARPRRRGRPEARLEGLSHPGGVRPQDRRAAVRDDAGSRTTTAGRRSSRAWSCWTPRRLLRRVTLSLAGRLPTASEMAAVADKGLDGLPPLLDALMKEDAFYDRLREGFNDIFLTLGIDGNAEATVLSYEHFEKTRLWTQEHDLGHVPEKDRQKARYKLNDDYRLALLGEPMKLIEHIVRNDRPFTEVVTADYIMVTPYTARGYGIFEDVRGRFKDPDDPFEYIPVKLKALKGRSRSTDQESATGFYPHAGLLGSFQYLRRYPTTETNRNRLRARMFYLHFLGVDALELAARTIGRRVGLGEIPDPDHAGPGMRGLPQDARPGGRPVPGFLRLRRRLRPPQGGLVRGHVRRRLRGGGARARRSAGGRCNGSASGPRRTPASRSPWSSTSITSSPAARSCRPPRTRTTRSTTPGAGPTASSAARSRRSPGGSPGPGSTSRTSSRTGSSPTSTGPTAWRPRSTSPAAGRSWTTWASSGCSARSRWSGR